MNECGSKNTNSLSNGRHPYVHQVRTSSVILSYISMRLVAVCVCVFVFVFVCLFVLCSAVDGEWCKIQVTSYCSFKQPTVPAPYATWIWCGDGIIITENHKHLKKLTLVSPCPPQILYKLPWIWTKASAMISQCSTTRVMVSPQQDCYKVLLAEQLNYVIFIHSQFLSTVWMQ